MEGDIQLSVSGHVFSRMKLVIPKAVWVHGPRLWAEGGVPGSSNEEWSLHCSIFSHVRMTLIDHLV